MSCSTTEVIIKGLKGQKHTPVVMLLVRSKHTTYYVYTVSLKGIFKDQPLKEIFKYQLVALSV